MKIEGKNPVKELLNGEKNGRKKKKKADNRKVVLETKKL